MSFSVKTHSLSALMPVKLTYSYNKEEPLQNTAHLFRGGFGYFQHNLLDKFQDAALSKKNCVVLTEIKNLNEVFNLSNDKLELGKIAGSFYLKLDNKFLTTSRGFVYKGGVGDNILITVVPITDKKAYLKVGKSKFLQIEKYYPYTVKLVEGVLDEADSSVRVFETDFKNNKISFKILTPEGYRFLSCGIDKTIRAVGVELNDSVVNSYHFDPVFVTNSTIDYNVNPVSKEISYYNELLDSKFKGTVDVKRQTQNNTNLIVTCPTTNMSMPGVTAVNINIALTKTNFSSSGTFTTSQ